MVVLAKLKRSLTGSKRTNNISQKPVPPSRAAVMISCQKTRNVHTPSIWAVGRHLNIRTLCTLITSMESGSLA